MVNSSEEVDSSKVVNSKKAVTSGTHGRMDRLSHRHDGTDRQTIATITSLAYTYLGRERGFRTEGNSKSIFAAISPLTPSLKCRPFPPSWAR